MERLENVRSAKPSIDNWEASNLFLLSIAILRSALERKETRGSHWRSDYPNVERVSLIELHNKLMAVKIG